MDDSAWPLRLMKLQLRNLRFRVIAATLLGAELTAWLLVQCGCDAVISLAVVCLLLTVVLSWPAFVALGWSTAGIVVTIVAQAWRRLFNRRTYRFSLATLFLLVAVVAASSAWYGACLRAVDRERSAFSGRWRVVQGDGTPAIINGQQIIFSFDNRTVTYNLSKKTESVVFHSPGWDEIGRIDFYPPGGKKCLAIYRRVGNRVLVGYGHPGQPRPTVFEQGTNDCFADRNECSDCSQHPHLCQCLWYIEPLDGQR